MGPLKMYVLLKMMIFYCYVSLPEGNGFFRKDHEQLMADLELQGVCEVEGKDP